jgi:hypothetical protein
MRWGKRKKSKGKNRSEVTIERKQVFGSEAPEREE